MNFSKGIIIIVIDIYQAVLSPQTGFFRFIYKTPIGSLNHVSCQGCRFWPTCSEYTKQAIKKYSLIYALKLSIERLTRCRTFNDGGVDPLV
jgi:hypothetical protein